jgi:peptide methionine sulfoxide reductase MsrA
MFLNHFNVVISKINFKKTLHNIKQTFRVKKKNSKINKKSQYHQDYTKKNPLKASILLLQD